MNNQIKCPNCGHSFDVEEALSGKLEAHFKSEYEKKVTEQAEKYNQEKRKLAEEKRLFVEKQAEADELFKAELAKELKKEKSKIEINALESVEEKMKALEDENEERKAENRSLKKKEVLLLKREAELKERQEDMQLDMEKQMLGKQKEIEDKARANERESFELEKIKLLKQIEDNKKLAEEMKRKAEQGSMQLQGEVQELALEDLLSRTYPFDRIEEVSKGVRGADSIQTVINSIQQECGIIVYESKRTKNYANDWIDKLKQDQITCKADIAVLVTETMPSDMDRFGEKNEVWICSFQEVKSLSFVLREMLIKTHSVKLAQENKGDKKELLYTYLTSNEFVQNIKRIVENYNEMINQLNSEKKATQKIWAIREKQIWVVQENISALFGSIKGIAGNSLDTSNVLELPDSTVD
ncbi:MAG: DUF2130 domain-containing protein [Candidatus Omnitrophica bacterium]|nr:DUF2130 domain-containing protein [Candidatus Omnitrophota bacterium]